MNKFTDTFKLEKWRVKRITLIVVVLILAGCQSQALPSTATPTEIPATATHTPTKTPEPTATATELVVPDNAVEIVGGGYAYVENGKLMLLGADGVTKEVKDPSFDVVFNTMDDATRIFELLNPEATKVTAEDFFLGGYPSYDSYRWSVNLSSWLFPLGKEKTATGIEIAGISKCFGRVKNPVNFPGYPDLGVAFLAVNGYGGLLPLPMGAFSDTAKYYSMMAAARNFLPRDYASNTSRSSLDPIFFSKHDWNADKSELNGQIFYFDTIYAVPTGSGPTYKDDVHPTNEADMPEALRPLRDELFRFQASGMGRLGNDYTVFLEGKKSTTGELLEAADDQVDGMFFVLPLRELRPASIIRTR